MKYVRELMRENVSTILETKSIHDAVQEMVKRGIGAIVVVDGKKNTVGIFTERDLLNRVVSKGVALDTPISEVMTKELVCAQMHDALNGIPELMLDGGFRHIPVVDNFEPVGMLSIRDVVSYLRSED